MIKRPAWLTDEMVERLTAEQQSIRERVGRDRIMAMFVGVGQSKAKHCAKWLAETTPDPRPNGGQISMRDMPPPLPPPEQKPPAPTTREDEKTLEASAVLTVNSLEALLEACRVDLRVWAVDTWEARKWDSPPMRLRAPDCPDTIVPPKPLWYVKARFRRRLPFAVQQGVETIIEDVAKHAPAYKPLVRPRRPGEGCMLEVGLHDVHLGMLAWAPECGEDYDVGIARDIARCGVEDTLAAALAHNISRVVIPVGSDLLHMDNQEATTSKSGNRLDVDSRPAKVFTSAYWMMVDIIDRLRLVAPVEVIYLPANHDLTWAHHLAVTLAAHYRQCDDVTVDDSPMPRKYIRHGCGLLGLTHGDLASGNWTALPTLMSVEADKAGLWAGTTYREVHTGHLHKMTSEEIGGIPVRRLPTLTPPDWWHVQQGYSRAQRVMESYVWSESLGVVAMLVAHARRSEVE